MFLFILYLFSTTVFGEHGAREGRAEVEIRRVDAGGDGQRSEERAAGPEGGLGSPCQGRGQSSAHGAEPQGQADPGADSQQAVPAGHRHSQRGTGACFGFFFLFSFSILVGC